MQSSNQAANEENQSQEGVPASRLRELIVPPDFNAPVKSVADFVTRIDFPECVLGEHLDLGGYTGVVVAVVKQSIKVKSREGATRSFKSYGLQRLYAPPPEAEPAVELPPPSETDSALPADAPAPAPSAEVIEQPNFEQPVKAIVELLTNPEFPRCAFGEHVEIGGYIGVVVEIANQTLKVRSQQGTSRNYNALRLRSIYGRS